MPHAGAGCPPNRRGPPIVVIRLLSALVFAALMLASPVLAGQGVIRGRVLDARNREPVPFANVVLQGARIGATADDAGAFEIAGLAAGLYTLEVAQLGFRSATVAEVEVTGVKPAFVEVLLEERPLATDSVTVTASPFPRRHESPLSLQSLGTAEIKRSPGGARDISQVIQSLPGVASTPTFRNDIIIRGGAPGENRFYLDGVEVPSINHFATQGSSGGPVGMLNVDFIREVELHTSAFPADRGNALSSIMEIHMLDGNDRRLVATATLGASDLGVTLDGPLGPRSTFILSARRSYLQFLFEALDLPFLPTYDDFQFKSRTRIDASNEIELLALGAIDDVRLNSGSGDTDLNRYLLDELPENDQWNYAAGAVWRHFSPGGVLTTVLSRNHLRNRATKEAGSEASGPAGLLLDYDSQEIENKLRIERTSREGDLRLDYGIGYETAEYRTSTFENRGLPAGPVVVDYGSRLAFGKYAAFAQASRPFWRGRATLSLGLRTDAADYSPETRDPLRALSPRAALSVALAPGWRWNLGAARYQQLPPYTTLGYRDGAGRLVNRDAGVGWIRADHLVSGVEFAGTPNAKATLEAFYKRYTGYPFLVDRGVSLANLGADFGVIGDAPATSTSRGRSYGTEVLLQQRLYRGWYGIAAYTFVRSEFTTADGAYVPSAWDNRHLVSLTGGKRWTGGWELGMRWRYLGGAPYTPDDVALSSRRDVWDAQHTAVPDYRRLNSERTSALHALDLRIDRRWYFRTSSLDVYLDVQNVYGHVVKLKPILTVVRDGDGAPIVDPADSSRYLMKTIADESGTILPTVGVTFEF